MGFDQPFMYDSPRGDSRSPERKFDPKAITRASWEPVPKKPKKNGPLVSFNRHPDLHEVPTGRTTRFQPMSSTTKWWIKWMRYFQMVLRALEMIGGVGLLGLMIIISNVDPLTAWVMRITPGVVAISCAYAIWHLRRPARARPPASSAAYQLFAGITDLAVLPLYAFGAMSVVKHGSEWSTILPTDSYNKILVDAEFYALISAGGLHVVSLGISAWLGHIFRRIANMPPDLNPLEDHLTSRTKHKRNKSSVTSGYTVTSEDEKRLSTPLGGRRRSGAPYEDVSRPPSMPFMETRAAGSRDSFGSSKRDSRSDLPSRQYQIVPGNSPRHSAGSMADAKRASNPRLAQRGTYTEIPLYETGSPTTSRPSSVAAASQPVNASPTRIAKFTEAWYTSDSLINRTQQRQRALNQAERAEKAEKTRKYQSLGQRYDVDVDSDSDRENAMMRPDAGDLSDLDNNNDDDEELAPSSPIDAMGRMHHHHHPNPLRSNPPPLTPPRAQKPQTPSRPGDDALAEVSANARSASGSQDIADSKPGRRASALRLSLSLGVWGSGSGSGSKGGGGGRRNRDSSIQTDEHFCYSKPYGELKPATPPVMVGGGGSRQVSSGNDYYDLGSGAGAYGRRNVSGKVAEEGLAGTGTGTGNGTRGGYSRYSILND
ncbi:hypothetical protein F4809DRAFT_48543 [Biscogniauxia mediterranea]|nr:hypothetical protein F4809DRAFT_48543 [Biscogniauxia mediterranea]